MNIVVQKYGGTSVGNIQKIKSVADRILRVKAGGAQMVVVVSAMGHTTDRLVNLARAITRKPSRREMDMLLSTGEQISIALLSMAIQERRAEAISMTGLQSGIITDSNYSMAKIKKINTESLLSHLEQDRVVIVAGFQGVSNGSEITTLGRGGSDTTASALAVALRARRCEIYTDVDGVFTTDPNLVPEARKLDYISYEEMVELAGAGAQVLHPRAVEIAMKYGVPIQVRPSYSDAPGTIVMEGKKLENVVITGVTANKNIAKVAIRGIPDCPGVAAQIFSALGSQGINIRLIIQSIAENGLNDISLVVAREFVRSAVEVLEKQKASLKARDIVYHDKLAEVSIVGSGIASTPGVAARMFRALAKKNINIELISSSEVRITCVIDEKRTAEAIPALHQEFKLERLERGLAKTSRRSKIAV
ncbi:MAG: aspartate kinase [Acidobacteria bacterium]|nr:MAG: aspartate kinase [Acidobacteriota bacterium]